MPDRPPLVAAPAADPCQPLPGVIMNWPIGDAVIECQLVSPDAFHGRNGSPIALTIKFTLAAGLTLDKDATLALLYIVNGSLDYSALFSQMEVSRHGTITFLRGQTEAKVTILTLPLPPNTTFELEVIAYPAGAGKIISGPVRARADDDDSEAEDRSVKALSVLATTALVTALGALAFALLRRSKD